eukprot:TRINITY_DN16771_c0_g1_i2.p1 TRINITY_DN16771_c0_g1~~TRINITY_DN16771_c0_g1_i2.p1  ORF type:complete len:630 (-),score=111.36 TRINITY_DN16771_c0_g1_i2:157-2046(-)
MDFLATHENPTDSDGADWHEFTPKVIQPELCMARVWSHGRGGQCTKMRFLGSDLCRNHCDAEQRSMLSHGRCDGPIPFSKLQEFRRAARMALETEPVLEKPAIKKRVAGRRMKRKIALRRADSSGAAAVHGPPTKRRKAHVTAEWLMRDGSTQNVGPEPGTSSGGAWTAGQVWLAAFREGAAASASRAPPGERATLIGSVDENGEAWAATVAKALAQVDLAGTYDKGGLTSGSLRLWSVQAADSGGGKGSDDAETSLALSCEAARLLRSGMREWFTSLLKEVHALSLHRVSIETCSDVPNSIRDGGDESRLFGASFDGAVAAPEAAKTCGADGAERCRQLYDFDFQRKLNEERETFESQEPKARVGVARALVAQMKSLTDLAREGDVSALRRVIEMRADPNTPDSRGIRPLTYAAGCRHEKAVALLREAEFGANPLAEVGAEHVLRMWSNVASERHQAIQALSEAGPLDFYYDALDMARRNHFTQTIAELMSKLRAPDAWTRAQASRAVGEIGGFGKVEAWRLAPLSADADRRVRSATAAARLCISASEAAAEELAKEAAKRAEEAEDGDESTWREVLRMRRFLRRAGPADLRTILRRPCVAGGMLLPDSMRQRGLRILSGNADDSDDD